MHSPPLTPLLLVLLCLAPLRTTVACQSNPGVRFHTWGLLNITVLSDGPLVFESNLFNVPFASVKASFQASFRSATPLVYAQNVALVQTPAAGRVLIDAGASNLLNSSTGMLFPNFRAAGIRPASVDAVLLTHGHPDHVAGLVTPSGESAFENAIIYVGEAEHRFWVRIAESAEENDDTPAAQIYMRSVQPYLHNGRLKLVADNASPLPGVKMVPVRGHSFGHNSVEIENGIGGRFVVSGDSWGSKPDTVQNPEWIVAVDESPLLAIRSRLKYLKVLAKRRDLVLSYHEQFPGLGYVKQDAPFFDWIPASTELIGGGVRLNC